MKNYCIKRGYVIRPENDYFDDTPFGEEFQRPVYEFALEVARTHGYKTIADVGCGSGFKLIKYFSEFTTVGVDLAPTVKWLRAKYPERAWREFTTPPPIVDMVIASDVIEHLLDPDQLLDYIDACRPKVVILSTPDRVLLNMNTEDGPPRNIHHVREWTMFEFSEYIEQRWNVVRHFVVDGATQVLEALR